LEKGKPEEEKSGNHSVRRADGDMKGSYTRTRGESRGVGGGKLPSVKESQDGNYWTRPFRRLNKEKAQALLRQEGRGGKRSAHARGKDDGKRRHRGRGATGGNY